MSNAVCLSIFDDEWQMMLCEFYADMAHAKDRLIEIRQDKDYEISEDRIYLEEMSYETARPK